MTTFINGMKYYVLTYEFPNDIVHSERYLIKKQFDFRCLQLMRYKKARVIAALSF